MKSTGGMEGEHQGQYTQLTGGGTIALKAGSKNQNKIENLIDGSICPYNIYSAKTRIENSTMKITGPMGCHIPFYPDPLDALTSYRREQGKWIISARQHAYFFSTNANGTKAKNETESVSDSMDNEPKEPTKLDSKNGKTEEPEGDTDLCGSLKKREAEVQVNVSGE